MIYFNETGWVAIFNGGGLAGSDWAVGRTRDVEGWDPVTGEALVVDPRRGQRRVVSDWEDFSHLERAERLVAVLPGAGWRAHLDDEGGAPLTQPVLGWLVSSQGRAVPVTIDSSRLEDVSQLSEPDVLLAPGEELRPLPRPGRQ